MRRLFPLVFTILLQGCAPMAKAIFGIDEISDYRSERVETFHAVAQSIRGHEADCRVVLVCSDPFFAQHFQAQK